MQYSAVQYQRQPPTPRPPPRLRSIIVLAAWSAFMILACARKAQRLAEHPFPTWMTEAPRWYDEMASALLWACVACACVAYIRHRRRLARVGQVPITRKWADRREVRVVLYAIAVASFAQLPLGVCRTAVALKDHETPAFSVTTLLPVGALLFPLVGIALVLYDRRRVVSDERVNRGLCQRCGYDLRASDGTCPECGVAKVP